jgi:cyclopropane fatty-acyl-phospholipid synthase-like methyltransferase
MVEVSDPKALNEAWKQQYEDLAREFAKLVGKRGRVVEVGCGRGQLTIPLAKRVKGQLLAVDSFAWPYNTVYRSIRNAISKEKLKGRISVFKEDYRNFLSRQDDARLEAVISSEFLPEIDSAKTHEFLSECHRVLRKRGVSVHSFLSPVPKTRGQRLLIQADTNPKWTKTPPAEWFSPTQNLVTKELRRAGFKHVRGFELKSDLIVKGKAAEQMLRDWEIKETFWKSHKTFLTSQGLEVPDWILCAGWKQ